MSDMTEQEKQLVEWLADMNEDDALALSNRMLLEEGADPLRVHRGERAFADLAELATKAGAGGEHFTIHAPLAS